MCYINSSVYFTFTHRSSVRLRVDSGIRQLVRNPTYFCNSLSPLRSHSATSGFVLRSIVFCNACSPLHYAPPNFQPTPLRPLTCSGHKSGNRLPVLSASPAITFQDVDCTASPHLDQYQIILLNDRDTDVNNLPQVTAQLTCVSYLFLMGPNNLRLRDK